MRFSDENDKFRHNITQINLDKSDKFGILFRLISFNARLTYI